MNLGQTMLTAAMFVLLVMSVISATRMLTDNAELNYQTEAMWATATIAQDLLQEAMSKKFDANDDGSGTQSTSAFTGASSLGPNSSESSYVGTLDSSYTGAFKSIAGYSDFDDYKGYKRMVTANNISGFVVTATVYYVEPAAPTVPVTYRTYYKVIKVSISHPQYLKEAVEYTSLLSY